MKAKIALLVSLIVFNMTTCSNDVDDWEEAMLTIDLVGYVAGELNYEIDIEGPTTLSLNAQSGKNIQVKLSVGDYTISVLALLNGKQYADGMQETTVKAGRNNVSITLERVDGVATPKVDLAPGTYTSEQTITLTTETVGATIYYTLDGTEPSKSSAQVPTSGAITLNSAGVTTLKAIAYKDGLFESMIFEAVYTLNATWTATASGSNSNTTIIFNFNLLVTNLTVSDIVVSTSGMAYGTFQPSTLIMTDSGTTWSLNGKQQNGPVMGTLSLYRN